MKLPLFGSGLVGKSIPITAQRRLNMYAEIRNENDGAKVAFFPTPGLELFVDFGDSPIRGMIEVENLMFVVHRGTLWEVNNARVKTARGTLDTSSGRVELAYNGTQVLIVDGTSGYIFQVGGSFQKITDANFLAGASSCAWQDGYFLVANGTDFQVSALDNGLAWNAADIASAESNPDEIVRLATTQGMIGLFGPKTVELWANVGAADFPYQRLSGGVVQAGCAAKWSVAPYGESFIWVSRRKEGGAQVVVLEGTQARVVSTPDLESQFNLDSIGGATGFSYQIHGHQFYQLTISGKTWLFDGASSLWSELSTDGGRHCAELGVPYLGRMRVGCYDTGEVFTVTPDAYTDNGTPIVRELVSRHLRNGTQPTFVSELWLNVETGVGGTDEPVIALSISRDGGKTWGAERLRTFGAEGRYAQNVRWTRIGRGDDFVFKVRMSDPVKFVVGDEGWVE